MAWYVSLTLRWTDLDGPLRRFLDICADAPIPSNHIRISQRSWHSTLYALAKINGPLTPGGSLHDCARAVLDQLHSRGVTELLSNLPAFHLSPTHLRYFVNNTTIQFKADRDRLTTLRADVAKAIDGVTLPFDPEDVHFPFNGGLKNSGAKLWGAIARSPAQVPSDRDILQQETPILNDEPPHFRTRYAILTISDESLTNHLADGDWHDITMV